MRRELFSKRLYGNDPAVFNNSHLSVKLLLSDILVFFNVFFKKIGHAQPLFDYLRLFKQICVNNILPEYCPGIRTHNFRNMSLLP